MCCSDCGLTVMPVVLAPVIRPFSMRSTHASWNTSVYISNGGMSGDSPRPASTALATLPTPDCSGQELARHAARAHLVDEELDDELGDAPVRRRRRVEPHHVVRFRVLMMPTIFFGSTEA